MDPITKRVGNSLVMPEEVEAECWDAALRSRNLSVLDFRAREK